MRPSLEETFFAIALEWAKRSTCPKLHVGCVLVNQENQIIASGYNGSPRHFPHCAEKNCDDGKFHLVLHAEMNAIIACAMTGVSTKNSRMFITDCPCFKCSLAIIQSGIQEVNFLYNSLEMNVNLLLQGKVKINHYRLKDTLPLEVFK